MKINYAAFVTCLVIGLAQVYALAGGDLDTTLLYRLAENGAGAVIAAIVATVILPVSSYSVIHTGLDGCIQEDAVQNEPARRIGVPHAAGRDWVTLQLQRTKIE